jgi:hypothetical protein
MNLSTHYIAHKSQRGAWSVMWRSAGHGASGCVLGCQPSKVHNKAEIPSFCQSQATRNDLKVYHLQSRSSYSRNGCSDDARTACGSRKWSVLFV